MSQFRISYLDASLQGDRYADFWVEGEEDGERVGEKVRIVPYNLLEHFKILDVRDSLSTYEFLTSIKAIKDGDNEEFIHQVIIPIALKQHQQKKIQQRTLLLMSELIKPKSKKVKETITYNKFGKLEKNKKSP